MSAQRGFTLIEVVVALAIFSLVMLTTVVGFRSLADTRATLETHTSRVDDIRSVSSFLRANLGNATPDALASGELTLGGSGSAGVSSSGFFEGGENWLMWKAPMIFGESYGGTFLIRLEAVGGELILRWTEPNQNPEEEIDWSAASSRILAHQLQSFQVAYRVNYHDEWLAAWERTDGSPSLIKLQIQAEERYWPELIVGVNQ